MTKPAIHDFGGVEPDASAPIDRSEHELTDFDKSVDALVNLLALPDCRLVRVDELRRAIESLSEAEYRGLAYYQKWLRGMTDLLIEKGVLSRAEIERKMAALRAQNPASAS